MASAQSFTLWQQTILIEITRRDHSIIACSHHIHEYIGVILHAHPIHGGLHIQHNVNREDATIHLDNLNPKATVDPKTEPQM